MAKRFNLAMEQPYLYDLTVAEIPDGGRGWLMVDKIASNWLTVHEGEAIAFPFENATHCGVDTYNLQSCTAIVYLALNAEGGYYGAWYWHAKGGYISKLPLPWQVEVPYERSRRGSKYHVAFNAWVDNDEWPKLIERLEEAEIPPENIAACLRPYNGFETFAVDLQGHVGQAIAKPKTKRIQSLDIEQQGLISGAASSNDPSTPWCCGCYLTTATCTALGLPDDNPVLNTLRAFRDRVLLATESGRREVERYYRTAPAIVAAIAARRDARPIYLDLYHRTIAPAASAILAGRHDEAYDRYRAMVLELSARFVIAPRRSQR